MPNGVLWQMLSEQVEIRTTEPFPELPFENGTMIPTKTDLPPGKDQVNALFLGGASGPEAILLAPGASDIPLTTVNLSTDQVPVVMATKAYAIEWQTARTLSYLDIQEVIENRQIDIVRFEVAKRLNRYAVYGEPAINHTGLYNSGNVSPTISSFNPNTATFAEWQSFLITLILGSGLSVDGDLILEPTTVLMSQNALIRAAQVMNPINGSVSVLQSVRDQLNSPDNGNINVEFIRSPWSAGQTLERYGIFPPGTNRDRVVVYTKSDTVLLRRIEAEIAQLVDEDFLAPSLGLTRYFPLFSCASSTMILNPAGVRYVDIVRALPI